MNMVNGVAELISLAAYARHRNVSPAAVSKAVKCGRLAKSVRRVDGQPKIVTIAAADDEWKANSRGRTSEAQLAGADTRLDPMFSPEAADRFAVHRLGDCVAIDSLATELENPPGPDVFVASASAGKARADEFDFYRFVMKPETALELARLLVALSEGK